MADAEGVDWHEVAKIVLHINPERKPDCAKRAWEGYLARAKWMTENVIAIFCAAVRLICLHGEPSHRHSATYLATLFLSPLS